jgi:hypothetical protein
LPADGEVGGKDLSDEEDGEQDTFGEVVGGTSETVEGREERLKIVRSCVGTGAGGQGWKREALGRESMIE